MNYFREQRTFFITKNKIIAQWICYIFLVTHMNKMTILIIMTEQQVIGFSIGYCESTSSLLFRNFVRIAIKKKLSQLHLRVMIQV